MLKNAIIAMVSSKVLKYDLSFSVELSCIYSYIIFNLNELTVTSSEYGQIWSFSRAFGIVTFLNSKSKSESDKGSNKLQWLSADEKSLLARRELSY